MSLRQVQRGRDEQEQQAGVAGGIGLRASASPHRSPRGTPPVHELVHQASSVYSKMDSEIPFVTYKVVIRIDNVEL